MLLLINSLTYRMIKQLHLHRAAEQVQLLPIHQYAATLLLAETAADRLAPTGITNTASDADRILERPVAASATGYQLNHRIANADSNPKT